MEALSTEQVEQHAAEIEEKGFSVMENAIPEDFLLEIMAELERLQQVRPGGDIPPAPFTGFVTRRWFDVLNDGDVWQRVATHPWILPVLNKVLGDGFLLSTMGTAVVGDGEEAQTIHGAGKNTSGSDRHALTINYCRGSMRQQENLMLGVHPSRMMTFPKELQDILGFKLFGGAGHIFAQDPRVEMERHYGDSGQDDPYLERRDGLHTERTGIETG